MGPTVCVPLCAQSQVSSAEFSEAGSSPISTPLAHTRRSTTTSPAYRSVPQLTADPRRNNINPLCLLSGNPSVVGQAFSLSIRAQLGRFFSLFLLGPTPVERSFTLPCPHSLGAFFAGFPSHSTTNLVRGKSSA